ncbi:helix-turn-helix domain-containing protein [Limnothrix redekei]|uniref:Helix-turn-helix domain-containing protein n=1 Tax=Limnothrix redekei LRLZ20PSL1 TaxID=3112953 RepID=A0ABW7CE75_9CYAN
MLAQATPPGLPDTQPTDVLLGQIEAELTRSLVYQQAIASLQDLLGESAEAVRRALVMVGREAARLALHRGQSIAVPIALQEPMTPAAGLAIARQQAGAIGLWPDPAMVPAPTDNPFDLPELLMNVFEGTWATPDYQNTATQQPMIDTTPQGQAPRKAGLNGSRLNHSPLNDAAPRPLSSPLSNPRSVVAITLPEMDPMDWDESLRAMGRTLAEVRQQLGFNLEQIHVRTHIPLRHLQAIESGDLSRLPEQIYVRGFVQRMAEALGLDGKALAAALPRTESVAVVPDWSQRDRSTNPALELKPWHLYAGYGVMVASGLAWVSHAAPGASSQPLKPVILDREAVVSPPTKADQPQSAPATEAQTLDSFIAPPEATR